MKKLFLATSLLALFASSVSGGEKDMSKGGIIFCCKGDISSDEGQGFAGTDADMSEGKPVSRLTPPLSDDVMARLLGLMNLRDDLKVAHKSGAEVKMNGIDINEALRIEADAILDIYHRLRELEPIPPPVSTPAPKP